MHTTMLHAFECHVCTVWWRSYSLWRAIWNNLINIGVALKNESVDCIKADIGDIIHVAPTTSKFSFRTWNHMSPVLVWLIGSVHDSVNRLQLMCISTIKDIIKKPLSSAVMPFRSFAIIKWFQVFISLPQKMNYCDHAKVEPSSRNLCKLNVMKRFSCSPLACERWCSEKWEFLFPLRVDILLLRPLILEGKI